LTFLHDWFVACYPDRSNAEIEESLASLSESQIQVLFEKVFQRVMGDEARYAAEVFSQNGWFMDMEFPAAPAPDVARYFETANGERAEAILAGYYRRRTSEIENELASKYPARSRILAKAFRMHQRADYDISVPLFLIHADGICKEVFGKLFFKVSKAGLIARSVVDKRKIDWIWNAVIEPFRSQLSIAKGCNDPTAWNRHVILHGSNVDYGTEINSLKAISLLSFLCGLDNYAREREIELSGEMQADLTEENILLEIYGRENGMSKELT
jgi:hypothetical protein